MGWGKEWPGKIRGRREKKKIMWKRKEEKGKEGGKSKRKGVEGHARENEKEGEGGCKVEGGTRKRAREGIRVLEARWAWAGLGYSLASQKHLFSFANYFGNLILGNEDDCLDKTFPTTFAK